MHKDIFILFLYYKNVSYILIKRYKHDKKIFVALPASDL